MLLFKIWSIFRIIGAISLPAVVLRLLLDLLVLVDVPVDVQRRVLLLLLLLHVLVLEGVRVNCHLVIDDVDITLPSLLILMQIV